jgi:hypothetical protein
MKGIRSRKGWSGLTIVALLVLSLAAPALANQEMHPGGRLFYPLWDISQGRLTFIIITRLAQFTTETDTLGQVPSNVAYSSNNNCKPGHTASFPADPVSFIGPGRVDYDDVFLTWYGKDCNARDERIHMSCGDIDLIFLNSGNRTTHLGGTITEEQGALDVHFVVNGSGDFKQRVNENSLLGHAVIVDGTQGWALTYPAAAAKSTFCSICSEWDGGSGTDVGYEPYPTEVFLPFALTDGSNGLQNLLSLWAPSFFPGASMASTMHIAWDWYDGRERKFSNSTDDHAIVTTLPNLDPGFVVGNFVCGLAGAGEAENDGFSRTQGTSAEDCSLPAIPDATHRSDEHPGDIYQSSTPIGWWDFNKTGDDFVGNFADGGSAFRRTRGLVGVVETNNDNVGDATRLWHKDPCEVGPRGDIGPPHLRDRAIAGNALVLFNTDVYANNVTRLAVCREEQAPPL